MLRLLLLACLVAFAPGLPARAQPPGAAAAGGHCDPGRRRTRAPQISPDDARRALEVLKDPQKRAQITSTLETIAKNAATRRRPRPPLLPRLPPHPSRRPNRRARWCRTASGRRCWSAPRVF